MPRGKKLIVDELDAKHTLHSEPMGSSAWTRAARMFKRVVKRAEFPPVSQESLIQAHNVSGATNIAGSHPSVYYRSGDTFAHITTEHPKPKNVGRSHVRTFPDYKITNTGEHGKAEEFYYGGMQHPAREPFTPVRTEHEQRRLHTHAMKFNYPKPRYTDKK